MNKISGVYKITNNITGDFYIGSSNNVEHRWADHKCPSTWKKCPNIMLYLDMQKYGLSNFAFEIIEETNNLKEREQYWMDYLKPVYNNRRSNGFDIERHKEYQKKFHKEYYWTDKGKEASKKATRKFQKKYYSQLCFYNGKKLTLRALYLRFYRAGIEHPTLEAKKYLLNNN